ncbi:DUF1801 domain-containing protein [Virgibacillus pantothenticus]|uniref:DUF1801 domain-containing protein n=1 Tax=Virgibacillus pantothenticus TaxID=1473 RepID=UPI003204A114
MIGFGSYHYKSPGGYKGNAMLTGFSPRKTRFRLYFSTGDEERPALLEKLGKHKSGKACVYVNQLADIEIKVLKQLTWQYVSLK